MTQNRADEAISFVPLTASGLGHDDANGVEPRATTRVALVNMPFAMVDRPSIQCGLLKSALTRFGHEVDVHYLNVELAAELGAFFYHELSHLRTHLLIGEWLFSVAAFGYRPNEASYRKARRSIDSFCKSVGIDFERLCEYRNEILPSWIERRADAVDWSQYSVIGFTSTFEQNNPAFAMARAIRERAPDATIVFGGANFDGDMGKEYLRALSFIDYAVVGEGDRVFPKMVERIAVGEDPLGLQGVVGRSNGAVVGRYPAERVEDMNELPDPDYDDFFDTLFRLGPENVLIPKQTPLLLIETSRGCWWGEKHHCTFCGLNALGMNFRSKSAEEVLAQMRRLSARYRIVNFEAVDNIIDYRYLNELCKPLAEERFDYRLFYEVKANLKREQLRTMAKAGIAMIQPGIESLNTHVLSLMRKGVSMLHNVRCIKWGHYYGMRVVWNILTGFPGERKEDYEEQIRILPLLRHLPPPRGCGRIWLERFSPYFFDDSFPVKDVRPLKAYRYIYPEDQLDLSAIAYFFDYEMGDTLPEGEKKELHELVRDWQDAWENGGPKPELVYQRAPDWIQIIDRRTDDVQAHSFGRVAAAIYEYCGDTDRNVRQVCKELEARDEKVDPTEVRQTLEMFCDRGLMLEEDGKFFSLALPVNTHW